MHLAKQATGHAELTHLGLVLVELALYLTLFTDAARVDFAKLRKQAALPGPLLGIGLPLTIALGDRSPRWLLL